MSVKSVSASIENSTLPHGNPLSNVSVDGNVKKLKKKINGFARKKKSMMSINQVLRTGWHSVFALPVGKMVAAGLFGPLQKWTMIWQMTRECLQKNKSIRPSLVQAESKMVVPFSLAASRLGRMVFASVSCYCTAGQTSILW